MLRKRVVTVLTFNDGVLFRTKLFTPDYRYTHNFVDTWSVDEVVVLDVTRPGEGDRQNFFDVVTHLARNCFVPLSVGGGIRTLNDVRTAMAVGADKVVVNTGALDRPELISEIATAYGKQCVVLSIDAAKTPAGDYTVMAEFATRDMAMDPAKWAKQGEALGAGEVMITSVERDGSLLGYDGDLCQSVIQAVSVPVLILGGAGNWQHFQQGFALGAHAVCTQNIYHFTETSIASAKKFLAKKGVEVRV